MKRVEDFTKKIANLKYEQLYWLFNALSEYFEKLSKAYFKEEEKTIGAAFQRASGHLAAVARELSAVLDKQRKE